MIHIYFMTSVNKFYILSRVFKYKMITIQWSTKSGYMYLVYQSKSIRKEDNHEVFLVRHIICTGWKRYYLLITPCWAWWSSNMSKYGIQEMRGEGGIDTGLCYSSFWIPWGRYVLPECLVLIVILCFVSSLNK